MAKIIKYNLCTKVNHGTEEKPNIVETLSAVTVGWNEINEGIAKREAHNGEYEIVDDGMPEPETPESEAATWDELAAALQEGVNAV